MRTLGLLTAIAALVLVTLAVYAPARHYDFVAFDDPLYVSENPHVTSGLTRDNITWAWTTMHGGFWIPLVWMSYMVDVAVYGPGPGGHHTTNVALHLINTLLLFWALLRMTGALGRCTFVAALFAVHPLHVESVAWITERKDVLSGCFWMLAMVAYVGYVRAPRLWRYGLVVGAFVLGLIAKPMVVTLPVALLLLDVWPLRRVEAEGWRSLVLEKAPLVAIAVAASVVAYVSQKTAGAVGSLDAYSVPLRLSNALVAYVDYLIEAVWPAGLSVFYSHARAISVWKTAGAAALLAGISVLAGRLYPRRPSLLVGWAWYLATLVPVIGLIQVGIQSKADRFTYNPLIGVFVAAAWAVPASPRLPRAVVGTLASIVIAGYAIAARHQLSFWQDSVSLWTRATEMVLGLDSYRAHMALGDILTRQGRTDEAIGHFTEAARVRPESAEARHKLGLSLAGQGRIAEAAAAFAEAVRLDPTLAPAHADLGLALSRLGKNDRAIDEYAEALRLQPDQADTQNNLGALLAQAGRMRESIPHFAEAVRLKPDFELAHLNLAVALVNVDELDQAEREFREVQRINPGNELARRALADLARRR